MKPDRSNYEIWVIDWLDGKLDTKSTEILMAFLDANPDLKEEAESLCISCFHEGKTLFPGKESLKRSASDLPLSQVEYLSVSYLENDITPEQLADLEMSLQTNKENKQAFDKIQKIKLIPPILTFRNKSVLKKQTNGARIIRLMSIGLSAAATIAILITGYVFMQKYNTRNASDPDPDTISLYTGEPFVVRTMAFTAPPEKLAARKERSPAGDKITEQNSPVLTAEAQTEIVRPTSITIPGVSVALVSEVKPDFSQYLASTNNIYTRKREIFDEDRSRFSKFIARNFRQRILKEQLPDESPLKTYEIAEAGIDGLNKLLGWNMALVTTNDAQGEVKSVYFSSKMLKFNAPVKKTEPLP